MDLKDTVETKKSNSWVKGISRSFIIVASVFALLSIGFGIGLNVIQVNENNTYEFEATVESRFTFSSNQELILIFETEEFRHQLHFRRGREVDLDLALSIRAGDQIRFRVRRRDAARLQEDTGNSVDLVSLEVFRHLGDARIEENGEVFKVQIWGYKVAQNMNDFNEPWRLASWIIPTAFAGLSLVFLIAVTLFLIINREKKNESE